MAGPGAAAGRPQGRETEVADSIERSTVPAGEAEKDRQFVTALYRGLEVLRAFRPGDRELGNQTLSERTGIPKPTITRLTHTLTKLGYLQHSGSRRQYRLGGEVLALGYSYFMGLELRERARTLMQAMASEVNAVISLGIGADTEMIYVESVRGAGPVTLDLGLGARIPMARTSMGRAYLAALGEAEREAVLARLARHDPEGLERCRAEIDQAVEDIASRGFVMSVGSWHPEVNAVATPLKDRRSGTLYCLNCGGPGFMLTPERLEQDLGPRLVALAQ
ncbi:MAG: IclR family transcriptional regulator [Methyloligellaceae bacterium]